MGELVSSHKMADDFNVSNDTDETVCDIYDSRPYMIVSVVHSASATVSALCCIFIIIVIFLLKKNSFFIQRLIIYLCIATLVQSAGFILLLHRLGDNSESKVSEVICMISGFLNQLSLWYITLDLVVITFVLLLMGVCNKNVARLEGLYVVLIFVFPLTFNWIPFINNSYGRHEAICWIRNLNNNCTEHGFGSILQYALWRVEYYSFLVVTVPIYIVVAVFLTKKRYCNHWESEMITAAEYETRMLQKNLREEMWGLVILLLGVAVMNVFPTVNGIYNLINPNDPSLPLMMLRAIFVPLQGAYIALVFLLDRETIKRLKYRDFKAAMKQRNMISEYPVANGEESSDSATSRERSLMTPYSEHIWALNPAGIALRPDQLPSIIESHQIGTPVDMTEEDAL